MDRDAAVEAGQQKVRKGPTVRTVIMLVIVLVFVLFCVANSQSTPVKPIGEAPLFVVLGLTFGGGLITGWLGNEQARRKRLKREG